MNEFQGGTNNMKTNKGIPIYIRDMSDEMQKSLIENSSDEVQKVYYDEEDEREIIVGYFNTSGNCVVDE